MKWGLDYCIVETYSLLHFLNDAKRHRLKIYSLKKLDEMHYGFYTPITQRFIVYKMKIKVRYSIGALHSLLVLIAKEHLLFTICFLLTIFILSRFVYRIEVTGSLPKLNQEVIYEIQHHDPLPIPTLSYKQTNSLYNQLKLKFKDQIDYLNVYQKGSVLHVKYTHAVSNKTRRLYFGDYVACKDGVIHSIDVDQGNVLVKKAQYVKKGQCLISHEIQQTNKKIKRISTHGKIYAYTYQRYFVKAPYSVKKPNLDFSYLLFQVRSKLPKNAKIDNEMIVRYDIIGKTQELEMQYVFIENIAAKET